MLVIMYLQKNTLTRKQHRRPCAYNGGVSARGGDEIVCLCALGRGMMRRSA